MFSFIQEVNEEPPLKNQLRSQENGETSSGSKKSHQYTHEYVYHQEIIKDIFSNNIFLIIYLFAQVLDEVPPTSNRLTKEEGKS